MRKFWWFFVSCFGGCLKFCFEVSLNSMFRKCMSWAVPGFFFVWKLPAREIISHIVGVKIPNLLTYSFTRPKIHFYAERIFGSRNKTQGSPQLPGYGSRQCHVWPKRAHGRINSLNPNKQKLLETGFLLHQSVGRSLHGAEPVERHTVHDHCHFCCQHIVNLTCFLVVSHNKIAIIKYSWEATSSIHFKA